MKRRTKSRASVGGRKGGKANRVSGVSPGRARATGGGSDEMDQATYPDAALLV